MPSPSRYPQRTPLKLPWLCIKCVIHNSDEFVLIYFATISNRTRRIVQHSKYPLKEIEVHLCWDREIYMGKTMGMAKDNKIWSFKNETYSYLEKFVQQKNSQPLFRNKQYIDPRRGQYLDSYTSGDTLNALRMGIDFMVDVFGCTVRKVFVHGDKLSELFRLGISTVKELIISHHETVNTTNLKYLLENIKVTGEYVFCAPIPANFSCDRRIFNCRRVAFLRNHSADWVTLELLCQLEVPQLNFFFHRFSVKDIVSYITHWFNTENRKLEYLHIDFKSPISLENFNIDHLNPMPFCGKRRNKCPLNKSWWGKTDMSSGMDILRKDGLLATLYVDFTSVMFYVWHKRFPDDIQQNWSKFSITNRHLGPLSTY